MCGGALEIQDGSSVAVCSFCETKQTIPKLDNDTRVNLYDRANHFRRNNDYDKAMSIYEQLLAADKTDAEAYWSILLCKYGVEYVEDPKTHKMLPTINRAQYTSIFADEDYKSAIQYADGYQRDVYEAEAKELDKIQKGILAISQKEEPFDIFICYKETDTYGRRTQDSVLAQELYFQLKQEGFKVFFSRITLEDKLGVAYEPYIFAALNTAKAMVVIGTSKDNLNSVWVKNEWSRYLALIKKDSSKVLIPAYRDMDPYDLPEEFSHLQAQDMSKLGFMQDLVRGIKKIVGATKPQPTTVVVENTSQTATVTIEPLLKRAFIFLEDADWEMANNYAERVLDLNPECSQAYVVKLLAELHIKNPQTLSKLSRDLNVHANYKKAVRFASEEEKEILLSYNKDVLDNIALAVKERTYVGALNRISTATTITDKLLKQSISELRGISGYKDADQQVAKLEQRLEAYYQRKREAEEKARIKAEEEKARKQRIAEENRIRAAKRAKKIKIAALCMLGVITIAVLTSTVFVPVGEINYAKTLVNKGEFGKAMDILDKWDNLYDVGQDVIIARTIANMTVTNTDDNYNQHIQHLLTSGVNVKIGYRKDHTFEDADNIVRPEIVDDVMWFTYEKNADFWNENYFNSVGGLFTPVKDGYEFDKWKIVEYKVKNSQEVHLIFEAEWIPITYSIKYNLNDGENVSGNRTKYSIETMDFALLNPNRNGYRFVGWSSSTNPTPTVGLIVEQGTIGDLTFTAHWEPMHYTITLDLNGGTLNASTTVDVVYNSTYKLPTPSKSGYQFIGWYVGNLQYPNGKWITTADVKVTAKWQVINYSLSYNLEGGTLAQSNRGTYTVEESFTLTNPTKPGYVFVGWTWEGQSTPVKTVNIKSGTIGNFEFTANWISDTFKITCDANGGSLGGTTSQLVVYSQNYQLSVPTREGYAFVGWYYNSTQLTDETGASVGAYVYEDDITATAAWVPTTYTISYNLNGGALSSYTNPTSYTIEKPIKLYNPTKTGYTFLGWTYDGQGTPITALTIPAGRIGDIEFTANWQANTYTITYLPSGGSVSQTTQTVVYDAEYTLETPIRDGYDFLEWKSFIFSESLAQSGVWKITSDYTLVAQWSVVTYNITYDLDGGIAPLLNTNPTTYTIEKSIKLYNPSKAGYTFLGWTYDGQTTPVKDLTIPAGRPGNIEFTAHWQANTYTIAYDANGGEVYPPTQDVVYGTEYTLAIPSRLGYDFAGWLYNNTIQVDGVWNMTSNPTFVAQWTVKEEMKNFVFTSSTATCEITDVKDDTITNITIPSYVTSIGNNVFNGCRNLRTVTFGGDSKLSNIGKNAFRDCYALQNIEIPNGVTNIDIYAFAGCWSLTRIKLPNAISTIKGHTFDDCNNLESVTFGSSSQLVAIEDYAFNECESLKDIIIPDGVSSLGEGVFYNCGNLKNINIPSKVCEIPKFAFYGCGISTIDIPSNITSIGHAAFLGCEIADIRIPRSIASIGDSAFAACSNLSSITFDDNSVLESIGAYAFSDCDVLSSIIIPDSVISIGESIFSNCNALKSLTIPFVGNRAGVTNSDKYQYPLGYLFEVNNGTGGTRQVFYEGSASQTTYKHYNIPSSLKFVTVTGGNILYGAFYNCSNVTSITIGDRVTAIGNQAFYNCDGLSSIEFSNDSQLTTIGSSAFGYCDNLREIRFDENCKLTSIGDYAFRDCINLTTITIPKNVETIGTSILTGCGNLEELTIPFVGNRAGITSNDTNQYPIGYFFGTSSYTGSTSVSQVYYGASTTQSISKQYCIPSGLKIVTIVGGYIPYGAFYNCESIECIYVGEDVTAIGNAAFYECNFLTSVIFDENCKLTNIGDSAFYYCDKLENFEIPQSVVSIGKSAFAYCFKLNDEIVIPDGVTTIEESTFAGCRSVTSITIPSTVTKIRGGFGCENLTDVYYTGDIAGWCGITFVSAYGSPMYHAENLYIGGKLVEGDLVIPVGITKIPEYAFKGCNITSVLIPDGTTAIGSYAFAECANLTSVIIPNSVTRIGSYSFENCDSLESITLPENVANIESMAFHSCDSLISVEISSTVSLFISSQAFYDCQALSSIVIDVGLYSVDHMVFDKCPNLTDIYYMGTQEQWRTINIDSVGNDYLRAATIHYNYVPTEE